MLSNHASQEFSIVDLFFILIRRRVLWMCSFFVLMTLTVLLAVLHKTDYLFVQKLTLSHYISDGKLMPIMSPSSIASELNDYAVLRVFQIYRSEHTSNKITASKLQYKVIVKDGPVILLTSVSKKDPNFLKQLLTLNKLMFKQIQQIELPQVAVFRLSVKNDIQLLDKLIFSINKLQLKGGGLAGYVGKNKDNNAGLYLEDMSMGRVYSQLYSFKNKRLMLNNRLASFVPLHIDEHVLFVKKKGEIGRLAILLFGFLFSLFFSSLLVVFIDLYFLASPKLKNM